MTTVIIHEAKIHVSRLLEQVTADEEIVIAKAGKPSRVSYPYLNLNPASPALLAERS
jgi:PHD/YefM family antitoxin component YafN of YafNO toxin-antitoxin module